MRLTVGRKIAIDNIRQIEQLKDEEMKESKYSTLFKYGAKGYDYNELDEYIKAMTKEGMY